MRFLSAAAILIALILLPGPKGAAGSLAAEESVAAGADAVVSSPEAPAATALNACKLFQPQNKICGGEQSISLPPPKRAGFDVDFGQLMTNVVAHSADFLAWLRLTYRHQPVVAISLIALIILPILALPGLLFRWRRRWQRLRALNARQNNAQARSLPAPVRGLAWITIEGEKIGDETGRAMPISGEMLRIGRESDNDVCLRDRSVHRYHALIHRSSEAEYFITDLSGDRGNGVWVNGIKRRAVELCSGDLIQLGGVDVRFERGQFARGQVET